MSSETTASTMKQEETAALVPKLRFPEFHGAALRSVLLGDVTEECRSRNGSKHSATSVMGVTKAEGIVPMETRLIAADTARYKLVESDWFAYNPMRLNIGSIARWEGDQEILVSPDYVVFRCITNNEPGCAPCYLDQFRKTKAWEEFVTEGGDGSVRVRIYYKDIARICLSLPPLPEQQKVANCLSSLDELIASQVQKVDVLKTHKIGLMQQLFPREGETRPRLRFPEFQDAGEWEAKHLRQVVDLSSGATPSKGNPAFWNGSIPWVSAKDMKKLFLADSGDHISLEAVESGARLVPRGTLLVLTRGMTLLKDIPICFLLREMAFNQDVKGMRPKAGIDGLFLAWILTSSKQYLLAMVNVAGHGTGKIDTEKLMGLQLAVPSPAEQQRIASCLSSLDALITADTQKLAALKIHKKGLMQQLFPSTEGDEI